MIAALYVQTGGVYYGLDDVDPWDEQRDARLYAGPWPVVAHPPCARWCRLAGYVESRFGYKRGEDDGCFAAALEAVRRFGGVLEHPAHSAAWDAFGLPEPQVKYGWTLDLYGGASCYVEQGRYGLPARKATWLYAYNVELVDLRWGWVRDNEGSGPGGMNAWRDSWQRVSDLGPGGSRRRGADFEPGLQGHASSATPAAFRDVLLDMARSVAKRDAKVHTQTCQVKSPDAALAARGMTPKGRVTVQTENTGVATETAVAPGMPGFAITLRKGFHITFENGWTVSVQFGPGNYADNYDAPFEGRRERDWRSTTAEVAAWPPGGEWMDFGGDSVAGYYTPAQVLALMMTVAAKPPANESETPSS